MNRRDVIKLSSYVVASASASAIAGASAASSAPGRPVPRWDVHELKFTGPSSGNPFLDVTLTATFSREPSDDRRRLLRRRSHAGSRRLGGSGIRGTSRRRQRATNSTSKRSGRRRAISSAGPIIRFCGKNM